MRRPSTASAVQAAALLCCLLPTAISQTLHRKTAPSTPDFDVGAFRDGLRRVTCPYTHLDQLPFGMLNLQECCFLYKCGLLLDGPFLEQGSFGGRSTVALASGIKQSGKKTTFVSVDTYPLSPQVHPHLPHVPSYFERTEAGYVEHIWNKTVLHLSDASYDTMFAPVTGGQGGQFYQLYNNLARWDVLDHVFFGAGVTVPVLEYGMVFSDCAHDADEVDFHKQFWGELVGRKPVVFAFDDTSKHSTWVPTLRRVVNPVAEFEVGSMYVMISSPQRSARRSQRVVLSK
jgi:hypothetical protein